MYKVIRFFTDLQDNGHVYNVGDEFPRKGMVVSKARLTELAGSKNRQGQPLIESDGSDKPVEPVDEDKEIKPIEEIKPEKKEEVKTSAKKSTKRNTKKNEE